MHILVLTVFETPSTLDQLPRRIAERAAGHYQDSTEVEFPLSATLERFVALATVRAVCAESPPKQWAEGCNAGFLPTLFECLSQRPRAVLFTHPDLLLSLGLRLEWVVHFAQLCHCDGVPFFLVPHPWRFRMPELWGGPLLRFLDTLVSALDTPTSGSIVEPASREVGLGPDALTRGPRGRKLGDRRVKRTRARDWLRYQLETEGPTRGSLLYLSAESKGIASRYTLYHAARELGVIASGGPGSIWRLPPRAAFPLKPG